MVELGMWGGGNYMLASSLGQYQTYLLSSSASIIEICIRRLCSLCSYLRLAGKSVLQDAAIIPYQVQMMFKDAGRRRTKLLAVLTITMLMGTSSNQKRLNSIVENVHVHYQANPPKYVQFLLHHVHIHVDDLIPVLNIAQLCVANATRLLNFETVNPKCFHTCKSWILSSF